MNFLNMTMLKMYQKYGKEIYQHSNSVMRLYVIIM